MKSFLMLGQSNMAGREDFNQVPEITNPLCKMLRNGVLGYYKEINQVLENLSKELSCSVFVSAKGLTCKTDGLHFDSKSYREFDKRYFEAYLKSIKK